jgi:hypothetical protein
MSIPTKAALQWGKNVNFLFAGIPKNSYFIY